MVTTIITAMAAYSNERVAAIILSVLYRRLTNEASLELFFYSYFAHSSVKAEADHQ